MSKVSVADVLELSISERIQLVEDIWDSIATVPQSVALTPAQREELDRRLEDYRQHPDEGSPWEEVRSRILAAGR
ncbi:MAG: addiction module protein [Chthoniobacterales bacterium]|nr:addiction module protein [Chthoniobacterales bacterium]